MKSTKTMLLATALMVGLAATVMAQPPQRGGGQQSGQDRIQFMQMFPVMAALDADKDGTLSAAEIARASSALATLDKNSDGKLSLDELRPERPLGGARGKGRKGGGGKGGQSKGGAGQSKGKGGAGGGKGKRGAGGKGKSGKGGAGGNGKGSREGGGQRPTRPAADE